MTFPGKEKRAKCWGSRDKYWECLDQNEEDPSKCKELKKLFENDCPNLWVQHFIRRREYTKFQEKLLTRDPLDDIRES